jgi:UPF0716 protein FxsA
MQLLLPGLGFVLIVLPMIEIALFVLIGGQIGVLGTLAAVIATGVIGAAVLSRQGTATWARFNQNLDSGQIPIREVFDGFLMILAAVLLITPGFATDLFGFSLTVPQLRDWLGSRLQDRAHVVMAGRAAHPGSRAGSRAGDMAGETGWDARWPDPERTAGSQPAGPAGRGKDTQVPVIEGELLDTPDRAGPKER